MPKSKADETDETIKTVPDPAQMHTTDDAGKVDFRDQVRDQLGNVLAVPEQPTDAPPAGEPETGAEVTSEPAAEEHPAELDAAEIEAYRTAAAKYLEVGKAPDRYITLLRVEDAYLARDLKTGGFVVSGPLDGTPCNFEEAEIFEALDLFVPNAQRASSNAEMRKRQQAMLLVGGKY
jgi:hypothetical protein